MASDVRPLKRLRVAEDEFETYDVFLSHRGPDTKTGFVSYLYDALKAAGLRPFLDCKSIDKGQPSWNCIEHAIRTAPVALVIFSESFAQSEWCLKELHVMLDSQPSVRVLPVFYKVRPWEVRRPESGQLKDGFRKLEARCSEADVEQWRADLRNASELMGWESSDADKRLEGDLVSEVVGKVSELANKSLPLDVGDYVVGVKEVAEAIIRTLEDKKNIMILGLWGVGGIGKSTLARELYNQLSKRFSASCYVEDVRDKVIRSGEEKVQGCILKDLCTNESKKIKNKSQGKTVLEERLCKKQILLVLDDIFDGMEVNYMLSRKMLAKGSICILTSRDKAVFEELNSFDFNHEIYIHDVQVLSYKDSKQVFTSYAFGGECKMRQGLKSLVEMISKACGGVPLVLKICGALLKEQKNMDYWEEVLMKLKCGDIMGENDKIFRRLRISYDALSLEHQEMFLDIACCLLGQSQDMAKRVWKSQGWFPLLAIRNLVNKALITLDYEGHFAMHDHLRDMGRKIAKEGPCKRLWMPKSLSMLKDNEPLPNTLQTLIISNSRNFLCPNLHLSYLKELRILICDNTIDVMSLPKNLLWFSWRKQDIFEDEDDDILEDRSTCRNVDILSIISKNNKLMVLDIDSMFLNFTSVGEKIHLKYLQILHHRNCDHPQMSLGDDFLQSKDLQILNLSYCKNLHMLPKSFDVLRNLEELYLGGCEKLNNLLKSIGRLQKLRKLAMGRSGIGSLPESFGELCNLEELDLSLCQKLNTLPESIGRLQKLRKLGMGWSGIESLPESFGELCNLEELDLRQCEKLNTLPESIGRLQKLRKLDMESSGIGSLPESFGELCKVEVLNLRECEKLNTLPESIGRLQKLRKLDMGRSGIGSLPESFGELCNLEELNLWWCTKLNTLPESIGRLQKLRKLDMGRSGIGSLPESFGELCNLEELNLWWCTKLNTLPKSIGRLQKLRKLDMAGSGIGSLPESFGELCNVEVLNLRHCQKLNTLPESIGRLQKLRKLDMGRSGIGSLPESFGELCNLEELDLRQCEKLNTLPESIGRLQKLPKLDMAGSGIGSLPESFGELCNVEVLNLGHCQKLNTLPESIGRLQKLRKLDMAGSRIGSLPESFGELCNLEELNLRQCEKLNTLPESIGRLQKLWMVDLFSCGIESLPESFGELCNLEELDLSLCQKLNTLPESIGRLQKLRKLDMGRSGIGFLPESFGELCNLEELNLSVCQKLNTLPESIGRLQKLRKLDLFGCGIGSLPESFGELCNLEELNLRQCQKLNTLPESMGRLPKLRKLDLKGSGIGSLPASLRQ
ncbi:hypothetical protein M758_3G189800 [Ceratodon purpureus]|nr:hypothetical protein M758_3G189800 [Ceratodon purpureus]